MAVVHADVGGALDRVRRPRGQRLVGPRAVRREVMVVPGREVRLVVVAVVTDVDAVHPAGHRTRLRVDRDLAAERAVVRAGRVEDQRRVAALREVETADTRTRRSGQLRLDIVVKVHAVIAGLRHLVGVSELEVVVLDVRRRAGRQDTTGQRPRIRNGRELVTAVAPGATRAVVAGHPEAPDQVGGVLVAALLPDPGVAFLVRRRAQLHHAERHRRARERVAVRVVALVLGLVQFRADELVDGVEGRELTRRGKCRGRRQHRHQTAGYQRGPAPCAYGSHARIPLRR